MRRGTLVYRKMGDLSLRDSTNGGIKAGSEEAKEIIQRIAKGPTLKLGPMTIIPGSGKCIDCGNDLNNNSKRCMPCNRKRSRLQMGSFIDGHIQTDEHAVSSD